MVQQFPVKRLQQLLFPTLHRHAEGPRLATDRLFGPSKRHLGDGRLHSSEEVEMAAREWLETQEAGSLRDDIFKLVPRCDKCITALGFYVGERRYFSAGNEPHSDAIASHSDFVT